MQSVTVSLSNREKRRAKRAITRWSERLRSELEDVLETYADRVFDDAYDNTPVDTGNLRSTIEQIKEVLSGYVAEVLIGTKKTTYALYVHEGTEHMEGRKYLEDAFMKHKEDFIRDVHAAIRRSK